MMKAANINMKRIGFTRDNSRIHGSWSSDRRRKSVIDRVWGRALYRLPWRGLALVTLLGTGWSGDAAARCAVVDLMPEYWRALDSSDAGNRVQTTLIEPHPDVYNDTLVKLPTGEKWAEQFAHERAYAETHRKEVIAAEDYLSAHVEPIMDQFQKTFPDYRCDYTFYIAPSFGRMDGAAMLVNEHNVIIFAPDVIPRYHKLSNLKVLIDHETFHVYHRQATGVYGTSAEAVPTILEALWSEGLATFVSWRMNPEVDLDTALLQPGIPEAAKPHLAEIAKDLLAHLDEKDGATFGRYFVAGRQAEGRPPRAGYYLGALVAQALAMRYTLAQLAHLDGPALHSAVIAELTRIASTR
jgi:hypothetical protein